MLIFFTRKDRELSKNDRLTSTMQDCNRTRASGAIRERCTSMTVTEPGPGAGLHEPCRPSEVRVRGGEPSGAREPGWHGFDGGGVRWRQQLRLPDRQHLQVGGLLWRRRADSKVLADQERRQLAGGVGLAREGRRERQGLHPDGVRQRREPGKHRRIWDNCYLQSHALCCTTSCQQCNGSVAFRPIAVGDFKWPECRWHV